MRAEPVPPSRFLPGLQAVADLLCKTLDQGDQRAARVRGLNRAVRAKLQDVQQESLSPAGRTFLRRLHRSMADLDQLPDDERIRRMQRSLQAVERRIQQGDDPGPDAVPEPKRAQDAPVRDVVSSAAVPVDKLKGVGPALRDSLATVGVVTVADLLHHLPRAYQDRSSATAVVDLKPGAEAVVVGTVTGIRSGRGRKARYYELAVADATGTVIATWFHPPPYLKKAFDRGDEVVLMGAVEKRALPVRMSHPEFEVLRKAPADGRSAASAEDPVDHEAEGTGHGLHRGIVVPLYGLPPGMGQRTLRRLVDRAFQDFGGDGLDRLPAGLRAEQGLLSRSEALRAIHFPDSASDVPALRTGAHPAHEALLWEDLLVLQVALRRRRQARQAKGSVAEPLGQPEDTSLRARLRRGLPFELTSAQDLVLGEIDRDLAKPRPMQRMLQGDVGSGKTVTALLAAAPLLEQGLQVAVLAPTEVLAWQWAERARALFEPHGVGVALLTGGQRAAARRFNRDQAKLGGAGLIVGTHALFQEGVDFAKLGLVIVDEQHRFGVFQRARLLDKGPEPHLLAMTATPIPRSLALTLYGDLDLSVLDERPPRGPLTTRLMPAHRREEAYALARAAAERDERAYIVCSRVEGTGDGAAAVDTAERLANGALRGVRLGVLHGRMDSASKDEALARFRDGRIAVLVGTTVVEVGVDVPQATVMIVEDAHRFGLAQLHQLRGRVGRSELGGACILLSDRIDETERLAILEASDDGFVIAEADLRLRGPGDLVGARQSGAPAFRLSTSPRFAALLESARAAARALVDRPDYESAPELAGLRIAVEQRIEDSLAAEAG